MVLFLIICLVFVGLLMLYKKSAPKHILPPAYPGELPVIGHLHKLLGDNSYLLKLLEDAATHCRQSGGVTHVKIGSHIYYLITDPEDAITISNTCFSKPYLYKTLSSWLGEGLVTRSGETWKPHRKILNPAFSLPIVHNFLGLFNTQSKKLVELVEPYSGKGPVDIMPAIGDVLLETSCLATLGQSIGEGKEFKMYLEALTDMLALVEAMYQKLWLHVHFIYKLLGYKQKEENLVKYLQQVSHKAIKNAKTNQNNYNLPNVRPFRSFIEIFLELPGITNISDEEFINEVDTAVAASFDTTWSATIILLACIGTYPEVQERMYEEIINIVGKDRDIEKEDLPKLVYTEAVIKEGLRWMPPAPKILRAIDKEVKLKNFILNAGTQCVFLISGINRHGWEEPDQFKPDRWLQSSSTNLPALASFSFGKRNCIGKTYAMTSLKVTIAHFIRKFHVTADVSKIVTKLEITTKPVKGHEIQLKRRN